MRRLSAGKSFRTTSIKIICIAFALVLLAPPATRAAESSTHPNLVLSTGDIGRMKRNIEEVEWAGRYFENLKAKIDRWIERGIYIPEKGGEWTQNYVSPESGRSLVYNFDEPHRHLDPGTGEYLEGEVYDASWRAITHKNNIYIAFEAGLVYRLTGDEKYAEFARSILVRYAKSYHKYQPHGGPAGLGRITAQSLGEARWLISAAGAYDLVADAPCMTEKDKKGIINRLFLPAARHIEVFQFGIHNIQVWHSVSMLMVALIAEKKSLAAYATDDLKRQIKEGIRPEGMWYETSVGYHFFAAKPFVTLAAICRNRGLELCGEPELRNMFTAMPKLVMPNGKLPALNDATKGRTLYESLLGLVAARYAFDDPSLDGIIASIGKQMNWKVDFQVFMYYIKPGAAAEKWTYPEKSTHMPGTGLTVLRRDGRYALLKYNPYSGGHDHPDKLSIIYYAGGRELFPFRGTIQYGHPLYRDWYRKTEAHNTVMVDGRQQHKSECEALDFIEMKEASAVTVRCTEIAEGVELTRTIAMTDSEFVDVLYANSDAVHTYDWFLHAHAPAQEPATALDEETPNPEMIFTTVLETKWGDTKTIEWEPVDEEGSKAFTTVVSTPVPGRIFEGLATGFYPNEKLPMVMWQQEWESAIFIAVTSDSRPDYEAALWEDECEIDLKNIILKINMTTGKNEIVR